jgi:hypothetical protein
MHVAESEKNVYNAVVALDGKAASSRGIARERLAPLEAPGATD